MARNHFVTTCLAIGFVVVATIYPWLPGPHDPSAATISMIARVGAWASLPMAGIGASFLVTGWSKRRSGAIASALAGGIVVSAMTIAGIASSGAIAGIVAMAIGSYGVRRVLRAPPDASISPRRRFAAWVLVPVLSISAQQVLVPWMVEFARLRAIDRSLPYLAAIERHRERFGRYPESLATTNSDFATGIVGVDRFGYEPDGDSFRVWFELPAVALDTREVVVFHRNDRQGFASHDLDRLEFIGDDYERRRGFYASGDVDRPGWKSFFFD